MKAENFESREGKRRLKVTQPVSNTGRARAQAQPPLSFPPQPSPVIPAGKQGLHWAELPLSALSQTALDWFIH